MIHSESAARWSTLSLVEQLANVGSEVERAIRAHASANETRWVHAQARALELFDLTAADDRWRGPRRREILRAREEFCRLFHAADVPPHSAAGLRRYFLAFATAARRQSPAPVPRGPTLGGSVDS
ncbi:MAG TPA: hypothetical protein VFZ21_18630 [Gemmatimonadaceae bacterium]|nr:hypothetical protein [Gemmatimonadaceae bacterium]